METPQVKVPTESRPFWLITFFMSIAATVGLCTFWPITVILAVVGIVAYVIVGLLGGFQEIEPFSWVLLICLAEFCLVAIGLFVAMRFMAIRRYGN